MAYYKEPLNLAMSGGGVKGIAYIGMLAAAEKWGFRWRDIAGVSAGALAGAFAGAGYRSHEIWQEMGKFDFTGVQLVNIPKKVPVVAGYMDFVKSTGLSGERSIDEFFSVNLHSSTAEGERLSRERAEEYRSSLLKEIITYSKYGCLLEGDYLEEWAYRALARKGVRTFGDLRTGKPDSANPNGYRVRMTGVDCNRAKLVVLPDDMAFYGIRPDDFEVAKAVRISTCVPFVFKPVEIKKVENGRTRTYSLVDGGVFDRFPYWMLDYTGRPAVGFKLSGGEKKKFFSADTALNALKTLISAVQDIGLPEDMDEKKMEYVGEIDTTKVHYLDFNLNDEEKRYLYNAGHQTALQLFKKFAYGRRVYPWFYRGRFSRF